MGTFASVTDTPCACGFLQRAADNPDLPIVFERTTNEFHFQFPAECGLGAVIIHHCPFCGGAAPESIRENLFAVVSQEETSRLTRLFAGLKTLDEVIEIHGPPDFETNSDSMTILPDGEGLPPRTEIYRALMYENLSSEAVVQAADYYRSRVSISIIGKYIGPPKTLK